MYIKRLSCLRERTIKFRFYSQLSYFQQDLKLDNLDYSIRICHQLSSRSLTSLITSLECVNITSSVLGQCKVSEERSSLEKYVEYNLHCTNIESLEQVLSCYLL